MKTQRDNPDRMLSSVDEEAAAAISAWHRGESLSLMQLELIEKARRECLARALGVDL